jgi:hypothetical protein
MGTLRSLSATAAWLAAGLALSWTGACGSSTSHSGFTGSNDGGASFSDATLGDGASVGLVLGDGSTLGDAAQAFDVEPSAMQTLTVTVGQTPPTVKYEATLHGRDIDATWNVDRGDIGTIVAGPSSHATFTPTETAGGLVTVRVSAGGQSVQRQVFVKLTASQNGAGSNPADAAQIATSLAQLGAGGGVGGVGGEGLGGAIVDMPTLMALQNPANGAQSQGLTLLYPYDKTVFPRSLLAPLLQWTSNLGGVDAVQIQLQTTSGAFSWTGTFGPPSILSQSGGTFIRHPIPQSAWTMATNTAGGVTPSGTADRLTVSLVVAKGGQGYGPVTETWTIAPARLEGTVYYNSYGTQLVKNSFENTFGGGPQSQFGAAVLGIAPGATAPVVVAGTASPLDGQPGAGSGCRVCHTVALGGGRLIAQHGDNNYVTTSAYDLKNGNAETVLGGYDSIFGWAGLSPDGALALTNAADLAAGTSGTKLYSFLPTSTTPLTVTGIPPDLQGGTPTFSPDGKHVSFDFLSGTIGSTVGDGTQLVALDFDPSNNAFSNLKVLATMTGGKRAGFPSFFPTNDAVAFHYQIVNSNHRYNTWNGAEAQIWWSDLATGNATPLSTLNGLNPGAGSYLPTGPNNHSDDTVLNYEPTVSPVSSGGYIWVIFTSRRLYGSVATTDPWQSDPRNYDATVVANATTKKLWAAAIDLNAPPGTDPSHPAFYLPGQELLAGNMRGFWVISPCKPNYGVEGSDAGASASSCTSGDQCCSGYCELGPGDAGLVCTNTPPISKCSQVGEKCGQAKDCCDPADICINGFCAIPTPM